MQNQLQNSEYNQLFNSSSQLSDYKLLGPVGRGAYSFVVKVQSHKSQKKYAMKVIDKKGEKFKASYERLKNEIDIQKKLNHKNILKLYKSFEDNENHYLLLEYCERGDLYQYLKHKNMFTESEAKQLSYEIALGLKYLHDNEIIHRDIKLGNILLTNENKIKICDFGLAAKLNGNQEEKNTICGTPNYISPEIINRQPYGMKIDCWSFGCILYALVFGKPPFEGENVSTTLKNIQYQKFLKFPFPNNIQISDSLKDLLLKIIDWDHQSRYSIDQILNHEFYADLRQQEFQNDSENDENEDSQKFFNSVRSMKQEKTNIDAKKFQDNFLNQLEDEDPNNNNNQENNSHLSNLQKYKNKSSERLLTLQYDDLKQKSIYQKQGKSEIFQKNQLKANSQIFTKNPNTTISQNFERNFSLQQQQQQLQQQQQTQGQQQQTQPIIQNTNNNNMEAKKLKTNTSDLRHIKQVVSEKDINRKMQIGENQQSYQYCTLQTAQKNTQYMSPFANIQKNINHNEQFLQQLQKQNERKQDQLIKIGASNNIGNFFGQKACAKNHSRSINKDEANEQKVEQQKQVEINDLKENNNPNIILQSAKIINKRAQKCIISADSTISTNTSTNFQQQMLQQQQLIANKNKQKQLNTDVQKNYYLKESIVSNERLYTSPAHNNNNIKTKLSSYIPTEQVSQESLKADSLQLLVSAQKGKTRQNTNQKHTQSINRTIENNDSNQVCSPLKTDKLKANKYNTQNGCIEITENRNFILQTQNGQLTMKISPEGKTIEIKKMNQQKKLFQLQQLPQKYAQLYDYCKKVCNTIKQRQPKLKIETEDSKFILYENNKVEATFNNGYKAYYKMESQIIQIKNKFGQTIDYDMSTDVKYVQNELRIIILTTLKVIKQIKIILDQQQ